jgi:uncharacterized coiled-coil protein SlyX
MKTYNWLNRNRPLSRLRFATAGALDLITKNVSIKELINRSPHRRGFVLIPLLLVCFGLSPAPNAFGQLPAPPPDGGYPGMNTAEGDKALFSLTTGLNNTAVGFHSLNRLTTGGGPNLGFNTGVGAATLANDTASGNTAIGSNALFTNTTGLDNTATGLLALFNNNTGSFNTATGEFTLFSNTHGIRNTANGGAALQLNTTGSENTATGFGALESNTTAMANTANGVFALAANTTGTFNTATGTNSLNQNTIGGSNTADGYNALENNTTGYNNTANGVDALRNNTMGTTNTAIGVNALEDNTIGDYNTGAGVEALMSNNTGAGNTAMGYQALKSTIGTANTALGYRAGVNHITGSNNLYIGNEGVDGENNTIRLGSGGVHTKTFIAAIRAHATGVADAIPVLIDSQSQLGTLSSSRRFKNAIKPMDQASEAILALKPVTFHYKSDATNKPQFGLIAEEVAKVNPDLVVRDENGEIYTVRYEAVNSMLLNEFLKEHTKVEGQNRRIHEQEATIAQLESAVLKQQKGMELLAARLKEQDSKIEKVSAQLKLSKVSPQTVLNNE